MLSGETSVGAHPIGAVRTMERIIDAVESDSTISVPDVVRRSRSRSGAIVRAAKDVGEALDVKALATFTQTGDTARRLAALHPRQPLLAFTVDAAGAQPAGAVLGRRDVPGARRSSTPTTWSAQVDFSLLSIGRLKVGDRVVVVAGSPPEHRRLDQPDPRARSGHRLVSDGGRRQPGRGAPGRPRPRGARARRLRRADARARERQRIFGGQVAGQALMAAGRTVPAERPVHSLHSYFLRPGDPHEEIRYAVDRIRDGRSFSTRRVVARQRRKGEDVAIFALTADFHAGEKPVAEHSLPMPDVPGPDDAARRWPRSPAAHGDRRGGALDAIGRAVEQRLPRGPVRPRRRRRRRTPQTAGWLRVAGRLPDDAARARGGADLRQRPDPAVGRAAPGSAAAGAAASSARASTTRSGSTGRSGPTSGSSTRPTARRPPAAGRCASARSGPPTARTSPPSPRRACIRSLG